MVAGFTAGILQGDYEYALKLGTAAGGATAFSDGHCSKRKRSQSFLKRSEKNIGTRSDGSFRCNILLLLSEMFHQAFLTHCLQVSLGKLQNSLYKYKKI